MFTAPPRGRAFLHSMPLIVATAASTSSLFTNRWRWPGWERQHFLFSKPFTLCQCPQMRNLNDKNEHRCQWGICTIVTPLAFSVRFWAVVVLWSFPGVKVEQGLVLWWVLLCERICQSHRLESWVTPHTSDKSNMTQKWPQAHWLFNGSLECRHCQSLACLQKESENTVSCKHV